MKIYKLVSLILAMAITASPQMISGKHRATGCGFPSGITSLKGRWEADCITFSGGACSTPSNGTAITTWDDESGNANTLTKNAGTCTYNTNQINGYPAITFASCKLDMATGVNQFTSGGTSFVVLALNSTAAKGDIISGPVNSYEYWATAAGTGPAEQGLNQNGINNLGWGTAAADTNWHQLNVVFTTSTNPGFRIDRTTDATINGASQGILNNETSVGYDNRTGTVFFPGQMAAVMVYSRNLSSTEISQVEVYLNCKYGL